MRKVIDAINHKNVRFTLFPDGQPHIDLQNIEVGDEVDVIVRLARANDIMHLLQISEALERMGCKKRILHISYLMAARYDRPMRTGDSFDLKIVANLINSCEFAAVYIEDVHSSEATRLIKRSYNVSIIDALVNNYLKPEDILICPDKGAVKRVGKYGRWGNVVYCEKTRELDSGRITLKVLTPEVCTDRNCVVIDDLCDGGGTFLAIAEQIQPKHLILIVTHGIFSKGLRRLMTEYDEIITTDSYRIPEPHARLTVIKKYEN